MSPNLNKNELILKRENHKYIKYVRHYYTRVIT